MKNIKKVIVVFLIFCLLTINLITVSYAEPVKVTKENLTEAFKALEELLEEGESEIDYEINVLDDVIEISMNGEKYKMDYDLTDKPTFSVEVSITQGMTYDEFTNQISGNILPIMLSYAAVANIQGAKLEDALAYILFDIFESALSDTSYINSEYIIIDDRNSSSENNNLTDKKIIYVSEFGEHVMEYVNSLINESDTITDSESLDSYVYKEQQKDVTDTSCKLVSTLTVNTDADFSKIKEIVDEIGNSMKDSINNSIGNIIGSDVVKDNTTDINNNTYNDNNITNLPQTGEEINAKDILYGVIVFAAVGVIALYIYSKRINQDK